MTLDNYLKPTTGTMSWDDKNVCNADGSCTEIYVGAFQVLFKDTTPAGNVGATQYKVRSMKTTDDLGNHLNRDSEFAKFVQTVSFVSYVIPEPNVMFTWAGKEYKMSCIETFDW